MNKSTRPVVSTASLNEFYGSISPPFFFRSHILGNTPILCNSSDLSPTAKSRGTRSIALDASLKRIAINP